MLRVSPDKRNNNGFVAAPLKQVHSGNVTRNTIAERFLATNRKNYSSNLRNIFFISTLHSPATLYRYTLNYKGAAFGWAKMPSQIFNPIMSKTTFIQWIISDGSLDKYCFWTSWGL